MANTKISLVAPILDRSGSLSSDAYLQNGVVLQETGGSAVVAKRPGTATFSAPASGTAAGMFYWRGSVYSVVGTVLYKDTTNLATVNGTGGIYYFLHNLSNSVLMLKNNNAGYTVSVGGVVTQIASNYPATTVPGLVYIDGTFYVMDTSSVIWGSAIEDPTTWSALNFISMSVDPSVGVGIGKQENYLIAFSDIAMEVFYDAANPTGSPLGRYPSAYKTVGCSNANSIAVLESSMFYVGKASVVGPRVYVMVDLQTQPISTPFIEKLLETDGLSSVKSFCVRLAGKGLYVLSLLTSNVTLVFDVDLGAWYSWTYSSSAANGTVTNIAMGTREATVTTSGAHGRSTGDVVKIAGSVVTAYNDNFIVRVIDSTHFAVPMFTTQATDSSGGITWNAYTQGVYPFIAYTNDAGTDLIQHSGGNIYKIKASANDDVGMPMVTQIATPVFDGGSNVTKFLSETMVTGDRIAAALYMTVTKDDYNTFVSPYRAADLNTYPSRLFRWGRFRRLAFKVVHVSSTPMRVEAIEVSVEGGNL